MFLVAFLEWQLCPFLCDGIFASKSNESSFLGLHRLLQSIQHYISKILRLDQRGHVM